MATNKIEFRLIGKEEVSGAFGKVATAMKVTGVAVAAAATAVTGATVAIVAFTSKYAAAEGELGKFATRLGTTSDVLSKFNGVAEFGGVAITTMQDSIQTFNENIGDAVGGAKDMQERLEGLGLSAQHLAEIPLEERMFALADALNNVENPTQRLRAAISLLDDEGAAFIQVIGDGSHGLREIAKDMEFLGAVVTPQAAANAEVYNKEMSRSVIAITNVGRAIADDIIPLISGMSQAFANFVASNRDGIRTFFKEFTTSAATAFVIARDVFTAIGEIMGKTFDLKGALEAGIVNVFAYFDRLLLISQVKLKQIVNILITGFRFAWQSFLDLGRFAWDNIQAIFSGEFTGFDSLITTIKENFNKELDLLDKKVLDLSLTLVEAGGAGEDALNPLAGYLSDARAEAEALIQSMSLFGAAATESVGAVVPGLGGGDESGGGGRGSGGRGGGLSQHLETQRTQYVDFYDAISGEAERFAETVGNSQAQLGSETFSMMMRVTNGVSQSIAGVITGTQSMAQAMSNVLTQVLTQSIAMLIRVGIQRLILGALEKTTAIASAKTSLSAGLSQVYVNSLASAAAIPIYGWAIAPGIAAANLATATAGAGAASGLGAGLAGAFHSGVGYVPREGSFLLDKGERVLSRQQNQDLTSFLQSGSGGGGGGGSVVINKIEVLPNATSAQSLLDMPSRELERVVSDKFISAFNRLAAKGVRISG